MVSCYNEPKNIDLRKETHTQFMKRINKFITPACIYPFSKQLHSHSVLFFDIETTGLSAKASFLYLIGAVFYQDNEWHFTQWFNDDGDSERAILEDFLEFTGNFQTLVHYNGTGFDLPYLKQRCAHHHINCQLSNMNQIDLYKTAKAFRGITGLQRLKQKDMEQFFGMKREEFQSGGDLIKTYYLYLKLQDEQREHQLLVHNEDDLKGLLPISNLLCFQDLQHGNFSIESIETHPETIIITLNIQGFIPPIQQSNGYCSMDIEENTIRLSIPVINGRIRNYYSNYKDYYYLPLEDTAIPKTLAAYVSGNVKKKATPLSCYTWVQYHEDLLTTDNIKDYIQAILFTFFY